MAEKPLEPGAERKETVEHREVIETGPAADRPAEPERVDQVHRVEMNQARPSNNWMWVIPLILLVGVLLWYVLSRGERNQGGIDLPTVETPTVEVPSGQ